MRLISTMVTAIVLALAVSAARADGLIHQLPADGHWVRFDLKMVRQRGENERIGTGTMQISSVGQVKENGEPCRWIEFKMNTKKGEREDRIVAKVLIPEKHLQRGATPIDHLVRGWIKLGDRDTQALTATQRGPLPVFLGGPLKDAKKLEAEVVDGKLGKLKCAGVTGRTAFKEGGDEATADVTTRLNKKAPFGVVTCSMKYMGGGGQSGTLDLTLADVGTDAKTELPDAK